MKTVTCLLFAFLLSPLDAASQTIVSRDPDPETKRCQSMKTAVHSDGSVVMVDYHGAFLEHADGVRTQNGGPEYRGCVLKRISRKSSDGTSQWTVEVDGSSRAHGITWNDRVSDVLAMPDGSTVVTHYRDEKAPKMLPTVTRFAVDGSVLWKLPVKSSPTFAFADAFVGDEGELFVSYHLTNYGYPGGKFEIAGGQQIALRKSERRTVLARLDAATGQIIWEATTAGLGFVESTSHGEILVMTSDVRRGKTIDFRSKISRLDYDGKLIKKSATAWRTHENTFSTVRYGDKILMTTLREDVRDGLVRKRSGRYYVMDLDGRVLHARDVSDQTRLAETRPGAPIRMLSPTNCRRGGLDRDYLCQTDAVQITTLKSPTAEGVSARVDLPGYSFGYGDLAGVSLPGGMWLTGQTYEPGAAESVTMTFVPDSLETLVSPTMYVWQPITTPKRNSPSPKRPMLTF